MQNTSHEQKKMMLGSIVVNQKQKCETTVDTGSLRHSKQTVRSNSVSAEAEDGRLRKFGFNSMNSWTQPAVPTQFTLKAKAYLNIAADRAHLPKVACSMMM